MQTSPSTHELVCNRGIFDSSHSWAFNKGGKALSISGCAMVVLSRREMAFTTVNERLKLAGSQHHMVRVSLLKYSARCSYGMSIARRRPIKHLYYNLGVSRPFLEIFVAKSCQR